VSVYEGARELYDSLTPTERERADEAQCPEHQLNVWVQSYGEGQMAWCEAGLSGAHLTHYIVAGCSFHGNAVRLRSTGRFCPGDCEWSQQGAEEQGTEEKTQMEHSDRGRYVTEQVALWIENDSNYIDGARRAAHTGTEHLRQYLTLIISGAPAYSAPWQVAQEMAPNDWDRVDWESIKKDLLAP
jgi:hypothetical protein